MNTAMHKLYQKVACYSRASCQLRKLLCTSAARRDVDRNASAQPDLNNNNKSDLAKDLHYKIKLSGPISVAHYMKQVLTHPTKGYYINKDVFGQEGDFTTSPEISQLFGEMIAVWIISECKKMHNKPFQIVELGPGRGTLARDILRVFKQLGFSNQISMHLVEVSPVLSDIQKKNLCVPEEEVGEVNPSEKYYKKGKTADNVEVFWYKSIIDLPEYFSIFIAQEFFDALPIHKFQKTKDGWFEVLIDVDPENIMEEKFRYVLAKTDACDTLLNKNDPREHVEISREAMNITQYISKAITQNGGFSLIIDYGHDGDKTDTFRAFRQHKQCDPLLEPGTADLTADVDFALLKKIAREANNVLCFGPVTQQDFLGELGINVRLTNLCRNATTAQRKQLEAGYNQIVGSKEMGTCFKVVSMFPYVLKDHLKKFPVYGFQSYKANDKK